MGNRRFLFDLAGLLIIAFLVTGAPAGAADITISPGPNAIQNAINAGTTNPGDTIILTFGTYTEHDITVSKNIIIRADTANGHGPADTIIDATNSGRIFDNTGGYALTIDNLTLQNGNAGAGGAIYNNAGTVTITGSAITGCTAMDIGGAITNYGGTVTITGTTITGCTVLLSGGAIHNAGGTVTLTDSTITGCTAISGGAIFNYGGGTVTITGSTISGCTASGGGAIATNGGTVTITGTTITGCTAMDIGGAIATNSGTVTITGTTITGCTASNFGGAIYIEGGTVTMTGTTITGCTVLLSGGAIANDGGTVTMTGSTITGCTAISGGAIYTGGGTVTMTGTTITGCTATEIGGAIWAAGGTVTIQGSSTISDCSAPDGGAIFNSGGTTVTMTGTTITGCSVTGDGGAIYNTNNGAVTIQGSSTISDCTATGNGGAIYNDGGTVIVTGSTITGCTATNGGGIYSTNSGVVTIEGSSTISDCTATDSGGTIFSSDTPVTITDSTISGCTARLGGAIYINGGTVTLTGSTITGCTASEGGGAIFNNGGTVTITDTIITGCTAGLGGAIYISSGTVTMTGSTITGCSATDAIFGGGAIFNGGTVTMTGSTISGCTARLGGVIFNGGTVTMTGSTMTGCTASVAGGAVFNVNNGAVTIQGSSTISDCTASTGGAIHNQDGTLTITSSTITGCTASVGGGAIYSTAPTSIHFSRIYQNTAPDGSGIYATGPAVNAENNWWGTNDGPSGFISGPVNADPWLVLGITADPASISTAGTSAIRTNLTFNSTVGDTSGGGIFIPDDITNTFAMVSGSGAVSPLTDGTANGVSQTTFTPLYAETVNISGTVDDQTVYIELPVSWPAPAVTGITPNAGLNISGIAITNLAGSNFNTTFTPAVRLSRTGYADIVATGVATPSSSQITCTFPITGAEAGPWNVVVTNPDGQEAMLANGFTITVPAPTTVPTAVSTTYHPDDDSGNTLSDFPSSAFPLMTVIVNIGGDSKAWQAIVTGTKLSDLIVTGNVQYGAGGNFTVPPGIVFQYISLVPARYNTITNAVINFTVPQSWLEENHIDPTSIVLYRLTANGWEALPTTVLYTKDGTVYFSAVSPGFSLFAIAGTPTVLTPPGVAAAPEIMSTPIQEQAPVPAAVAKALVTTQTTAPPVPSSVPAGSSSFPVVPALIGLCCVGLVGGGWYFRRWWIRRQNPALFAEYD